MFTLKNKVGGQLVCTLKSGQTLRLNNNESTTIMESDVTSYIENLSKRGLVVLTKESKKKNTYSRKSKEIMKEE